MANIYEIVDNDGEHFYVPTKAEAMDHKGKVWLIRKMEIVDGNNREELCALLNRQNFAYDWEVIWQDE